MTDSSEIAFLRGYKDAIMHFNILDRNLAYCLRWASSCAGNEQDLLTVLSYTYDKKLRKIESLIKRSMWETEYSQFLALAEQCRSLRNKLVHGHWEFVARLPKPIRFHVPAPFEEKGDFTQDEFSAQVGCFQRTNSLFVVLQKKHPIALGSKRPNKSPEPTPTAVTPRATGMKAESKQSKSGAKEARGAPAAVVAHL